MPITPGCQPLPATTATAAPWGWILGFLLDHRLDRAAFLVEAVEFGGDRARLDADRRW